MTISAVSLGAARSKAITKRIEAFRNRGDGHFFLACHAALPIALTPDLLYCLWANFQQDSHGNTLEIPWIAVTDLLLSSLCEEVGYNLYEMEAAVQQALMRQLQIDHRFGAERVRELADFVLAYVAQQSESPDSDLRDFAQAQKWRATAYTNPAEAAREIAAALAQLSLAEKTEWIRMAALLETLAEPLSSYRSLLIHAAAMADFCRGKEAEAAVKFREILGRADQVKVAGVNLPVLVNLVPPQPRAASFSRVFWQDFLRQYYWPVAGAAAVSIGVIGFTLYQIWNQSPHSPDLKSAVPVSPSPLPPPASPAIPSSPSPSGAPSPSIAPSPSASTSSPVRPAAPAQPAPLVPRPANTQSPKGHAPRSIAQLAAPIGTTSVVKAFGNSTGTTSPSTPPASATPTTPKTTEDFFQRAAQRYGEGDYAGAISYFDQAIKLDPNSASAYINRGNARSALGDKQGALSDYSQAIKLDPNSALAYTNRGIVRSALGKMQEALSDYSQAIKLDPNSALAYIRRGNARSALGDKQGALSDYNQAIKLDPNSALAYINRGNACSALGKMQEALSDYSQAIKLDPNSASAYINRGIVRSALGDKQGVLSDFKKAAELYQQQGRSQDYQDTLNRIRQLQP
jgi:tetratricopeptide (TPR) repeat protein